MIDGRINCHDSFGKEFGTVSFVEHFPALMNHHSIHMSMSKIHFFILTAKDLHSSPLNNGEIMQNLNGDLEWGLRELNCPLQETEQGRSFGV